MKFYISETNIKYDDIRKKLRKITKHQLRIVDRFLLLEKQIISEYILNNIYNSKNDEAEKRVLINSFIDLEEKTDDFILTLKNYKDIKRNVKKHIPELLDNKDENRIEIEGLFIEYNKFARKKINNSQQIIDNYRNKAFHNSIPNTGTFQAGINLLDQHIK